MAGLGHLDRLAGARVASLATVRPDGRPHVVPVTFALASGDVVIAVDHKPKTTRRLQRIVNVETNPGVSLLAEHWSEDWRHLWWVRVDGTAAVLETDDEAIDALVTKYEQYRGRRPQGPVIRIRIDSVTGWSAR